MRIHNQRGATLIFFVIVMTVMAALGAGIYTMTTSSTFGELLATRDYNAYHLSKAGMRYAAFVGSDASTNPAGTYCMDGGQCFTITVDDTDPAFRRFDAIGFLGEGTFLASTRLLAYNMPVLTAPGGGLDPLALEISFDHHMGDFPQPEIGLQMNKAGAVTVDEGNKEIRLGDGTAGTVDSFGSAVYGGSSYLGNCSGGKCDFGTGIRAYFEFRMYPEDFSTMSTSSADGFTFALFSGITNAITATGGVPADVVASLGETVGYAGPGTDRYVSGGDLGYAGPGTGPGWQPPKMAIEFDTYPNQASNSITLPGSRRDPVFVGSPSFRNHLAVLFWGENHAAPYRTDATLANAVGLRCAPNDEFIRSLYRSILGRHAEPGGLQSRTNVLNTQTTTANQNAARNQQYREIFLSDEYIGRNRNDAQFVGDVIKAVLGVATPAVTGNCPVGQFYAQYYNSTPSGRNFNQLVFSRCENAPIIYDWGTGGPGNGVGNDDFAVRWTGVFPFMAGTYTFRTRTDDGVRLWVDGTLIIDQWRDQAPAVYTATRTFATAGFREVIMEYYERAGGAVAELTWTPADYTVNDRTAFLNIVLASSQYTSNVNACGTYSQFIYQGEPIGSYNCNNVLRRRVSTALDCSGPPTGKYNRDRFDDNVHSEGGREQSFWALPLSPRNSAPGDGGFYAPLSGVDRQCASSSDTCRWFEDGHLHTFRIEIERATASHACATPGLSGNCYNYRVMGWIDCNGLNPSTCSTVQMDAKKNVQAPFTAVSPQIDRTVELHEYWHQRFEKMIFGWTGATGQPGFGVGQEVTLTDFRIAFRTPQPCPAVTSITPATLPDASAAIPYWQVLAAEPASAAPYRWDIVGGALPAGLTLNLNTGVISGTTTSTGGVHNFTVRTTNMCGGWRTQSYTITVSPSCTGGIVTYVDGKTIHRFNSSGTLTCFGDVTAEVLVVGGGGGAGFSGTNVNNNGAGGGAGGLVHVPSHPLSSGTYAVTVGLGGASSTTQTVKGSNGQNSSFDVFTAIGGGGGGSRGGGDDIRAGNPGGSGGGGGKWGSNGWYGVGGAGTPSQGHGGANSSPTVTGGGGGAGGPAPGTSGGPGLNIFGTTYARGGDAESNSASGGDNTGNGGNSSPVNSNARGGFGGSGIVVIRY